MGFRSGSYCTVWSVEKKSDTWTKVRLSISKKNKNTGEFEQDFSGFVDFLGSNAAPKAADLKERDRIKLVDVDVSNSYDKEKGVTYWNAKCFSFEPADFQEHRSNSSPANVEGDNGFLPASDDEIMPW